MHDLPHLGDPPRQRKKGEQVKSFVSKLINDRPPVNYYTGDIYHRERFFCFYIFIYWNVPGPTRIACKSMNL